MFICSKLDSNSPNFICNHFSKYQNYFISFSLKFLNNLNPQHFKLYQNNLILDLIYRNDKAIDKLDNIGTLDFLLFF